LRLHHLLNSYLLQGVHGLLHWQRLLQLLLFKLIPCSCIGIFWLGAACQASGSHSDAAWHATGISTCAGMHINASRRFMQMLEIKGFLLLLLLLLLWLRFLPCRVGS
jgi:hypothetical protein